TQECWRSKPWRPRSKSISSLKKSKRSSSSTSILYGPRRTYKRWCPPGKKITSFLQKTLQNLTGAAATDSGYFGSIEYMIFSLSRRRVLVLLGTTGAAALAGSSEERAQAASSCLAV